MWHAEMRAEAGPHAELDLSLKGVALEEAVETQESRRKTEQWEEWLAQILDWADEPTTIQEIMHELGGTAYEADALADDAHDPATLAGTSRRYWLREGITESEKRDGYRVIVEDYDDQNGEDLI